MDSGPLAFSFLIRPPAKKKADRFRDLMTRMERLSIESCLSAGYNFRLYSYSPRDLCGALPKPAELVDAESILPREFCVPDQSGSYAWFQLAFMCAALFKHGGLWVDPDYVLTRQLPDAPFLALQAHEPAQIYLHALRLPAGSALAQYAAEAAIAAKDPTEYDCSVAQTLQESWPQRKDAILVPWERGCPYRREQADLVINQAPEIQPEFVYGYKLWRDAWEHEDCTPSSKFAQCTLFEQLWSLYFGAPRP